jgi:hypothetical protein
MLTVLIVVDRCTGISTPTNWTVISVHSISDGLIQNFEHVADDFYTFLNFSFQYYENTIQEARQMG